MQSWRTTVSGVAAILAAVAGVAAAIANGQPVDWTSAFAAVMAGVGLIAARDHKADPEAAGAK
jgi:peptidoglycan/LPS O-acetylase OafA/YrhL